MLKCDICGKEFANRFLLAAHFGDHSVRPVKDKPLSYLICLPDGVTEGRFEAAEAFADGYAELREMHPGKRFHFFPFSYKSGHADGIDPALTSILAIEI